MKEKRVGLFLSRNLWREPIPLFVDKKPIQVPAAEELIRKCYLFAAAEIKWSPLKRNRKKHADRCRLCPKHYLDYFSLLLYYEIWGREKKTDIHTQ